MIRALQLTTFLLASLMATTVAAWPQAEHAKGSPAPQISTNCEDLSAEPITYGMEYGEPGSLLPFAIQDMQDVWASGGCVGCHNNTAMGGLRLDQEEFGGFQVVLAASFRNPNIFRAIPSNPEDSLLYAMLNCTPPTEPPDQAYPVMPPTAGGPPVRIARNLRALVYDWIEQGARGFSFDGDAYSDVVFRDSHEGVRLQRQLAPPP